MIFLLVATFTSIIFIPFMIACVSFVRKAQTKRPPNYEFPSLLDFWMTIASGLLFVALEIILKKSIAPYLIHMCKDKDDPELQ